MRDQIHTIPVLDALRSPKTCPFCVMHSQLEQSAVAFIMGPAYMEDDVRMETNRKGFCAAHLDKMYAEQNRLGLALMLHTFMQQLNKDANAAANSGLPSFRFGKKSAPTPAARLSERLSQAGESCYLCERIENTFDRYMDTFFTLWTGDSEAKALIEAVPGYCLPHFSRMLQTAEAKLNKAKREGFLSVVMPVQQRFMKEMESDLEWFTLKFDYRNTNEPWKNAKDALPRAMALLHGGEPEDKEGSK